jgi:AcrR family transcriptional regulator
MRHQRARVVEAVAHVTSVAGYAPMTVADIIETAGISRRTFYDLYDSKEDAFLKALDAVSRDVFALVLEAFESGEGLAGRLSAAIGALLDYFAQNPADADMCLVAVMGAGPDAVDRRNEALEKFAGLIRHAVDHELPKRNRPPELVAEAIVGGVYEILYARVLQGHANQLPQLLPDLMYSVLQPYLGREQAIAEQKRLRRKQPRQ